MISIRVFLIAGLIFAGAIMLCDASESGALPVFLYRNLLGSSFYGRTPYMVNPYTATAFYRSLYNRYTNKGMCLCPCSSLTASKKKKKKPKTKTDQDKKDMELEAPDFPDFNFDMDFF